MQTFKQHKAQVLADRRISFRERLGIEVASAIERQLPIGYSIRRVTKYESVHRRSSHCGSSEMLTWEIYHDSVKEKRVGGFEFYQNAWYRLDVPSDGLTRSVGVPASILQPVRSIVSRTLYPIVRGEEV